MKSSQSGGDESKSEFEENKSQGSKGGSVTVQEVTDTLIAEMGSWTGTNEGLFMHKGQPRKWTKGVLVIINTRLGLDKIPQDAYIKLADIFRIPQNIGIIGGRDKFGLYFVGSQKDRLILLDPHYSQEGVLDESEIISKRNTFRWQTIQTIPVKKLDPWVGIGFLIRNYEDYQTLTDILKKIKNTGENLIGIVESKITPTLKEINENF